MTPVRLERGRRASVAERARLTAEILRGYVQARRLMRGTPLPETLKTLRADARDAPAPDGAEARRLGRIVVKIIGRLPDARCLLRSLVLTQMLARRGGAPVLVLGVEPGTKLSAHAWVELAGEPVLPTGGDRFERLADF